MRFANHALRINVLGILLALTAAAFAQQGQQAQQAPRPDIDQIAEKALAATGVPSASVAIVENGKISYQFTASAILMLAEERRLTLDDHVEKYVPGLTRGNEVTIRQILSHTSGY